MTNQMRTKNNKYVDWFRWHREKERVWDSESIACGVADVCCTVRMSIFPLISCIWCLVTSRCHFRVHCYFYCIDTSVSVVVHFLSFYLWRNHRSAVRAISVWLRWHESWTLCSFSLNSMHRRPAREFRLLFLASPFRPSNAKREYRI